VPQGRLVAGDATYLFSQVDGVREDQVLGNIRFLQKIWMASFTQPERLAPRLLRSRLPSPHIARGNPLQTLKIRSTGGLANRTGRLFLTLGEK